MITAARNEIEPVTESGIELLTEMLAIPSPSTQERAPLRAGQRKCMPPAWRWTYQYRPPSGRLGEGSTDVCGRHTGMPYWWPGSESAPQAGDATGPGALDTRVGLQPQQGAQVGSSWADRSRSRGRTSTPRVNRCGSSISSKAEKLLECPLCGVAERNKRCSKREKWCASPRKRSWPPKWATREAQARASAVPWK